MYKQLKATYAQLDFTERVDSSDAVKYTNKTNNVGSKLFETHSRVLQIVFMNQLLLLNVGLLP